MSVLTIDQFYKFVEGSEKLELSNQDISCLQNSYDFLKKFSEGKIIYGINTGFGPMTQVKIKDEDLERLQYNLIRSHSTGAGKVLNAKCARAVMLARLNSLLGAKSGVSIGVIKVLKELINSDIVPEIYEHGGVGASGDLVQLSHLALNLIGEGYVYVNGDRLHASDAMRDAGIEPAKLELRDGLGLINGTSCMTGVGIVNVQDARNLLDWAVFCSTCMNELLESFDDSMSEQLNNAKRHKGQKFIARQMRELISDSKRIKDRVEYYKGEEGKVEVFEKKVQEYYSIRCVPQILGPVYDTIENVAQVLTDELNSTNDNPIIDIESEGVFHGGNFHGDYVSLEMDKLKVVVTKMIMLCERQLNFLMNPNLNQMFPPFLNSESLGINFGLQGLQFTATSTTAESQTYCFPNYIHSIPNNNENQDIVSMGMNSASIAKKVIDNAYQVMSIHLMAVYKAFTMLSSEDQESVSSKVKLRFTSLSEIITYSSEDKPLSEDVKKVEQFIRKFNS